MPHGMNQSAETYELLDNKQIPRVLMPSVATSDRSPNPVDDPAPIRMKQASREVARVACDDLLLPCIKLDDALVFPAGTMLWQEARPVLRHALNVGAGKLRGVTR
jgi:hypothetical protein